MSVFAETFKNNEFLKISILTFFTCFIFWGRRHEALAFKYPPTPSLDGGARRVESPPKVCPETSKTRFPGRPPLPPTLGTTRPKSAQVSDFSQF